MTIYYNYNGTAMPMSADPQTMVYGTSAGGETLYAVAGPSGISSEGGGDDVMIDNVNGDVTFIAKVPTDQVQVANGLTGVRTIVAFAEYALPANVQNLYFVGGYDWGIGNGLDNLIVMQGNDFDVIDGGAGNDVLVGGFGQNNFQVAAGNGNDVIYNFNKGYDTVRMPGTSFTSFAQIQAAMTQVGSDVVLHIDSSETLTFRGLNISDLHARNFFLPLDRSQLGAMTFDDEFNSLQLYNPQTGTGHWQTNVGGPANAEFTYQPQGNQEQELYTTPAFKGTGSSPLGLNPYSINNGVLSITASTLTVAQSNAAWGQSYSSGMLTTRGVFMQQYGYFEMRAELPQGAGTWPAFWLSQDPYDRGGEADVMEHLGMYPNSAYIRAYDTSSVAEINAWLENPTGFHTYGMLWTATTTTFYIDNLAVFTTPTPASWDKPAYMLLNLAMGGWGGPVDDSAVPAKFNIDYVHVYGLADNSQITPTVMPTAYPAGDYVAPDGVTTITLSGPAAQTVTGNNAGDIFYSSDNANHIHGGTGNDRFYMGSGDTVSGGGGGDQFFFEAIPAAGTRITDFASDDAINMFDVLKTIGYTDWDTVAKGYIKITDDGAGAAQIWVDPNPQANANDWHLLTTLDGVTSDHVVVNAGYITVSTSANEPAAGSGGTGGTGGTGGSGSPGGGTGGGAPGGSDGGPPGGGSTGGSTGGVTPHHAQHDLNGDGLSDVLFREPGTGAWGYAAFSGSGAWNWVPEGGSTASYGLVGVADFNGDGTSDVLFREGSTGNWGFAAMTPSGGWSWNFMGGSTASYNEVQAGDFNGDGVADIAFREGSTGNWGIAFMNHAGSYTWTPMGGSTASYSMVGAGDFNGDGTSDILFRDNHSGAWGIAFMNTQGGYAWAPEGGSTASYSVVGTGDFNGDGTSDILFRENSTGNWGYAAMDHSGAWAWDYMGGSTQSYTVASVGDYNGDGFADIAFRENATGAWGVAQMHGTSYAWLPQGGSTQDFLGY